MSRAPSPLRELLTAAGLADPYVIHESLRAQWRSGSSIGNLVADWAGAGEVLAHRDLSSDRVDAICSPLDDETQVEIQPVRETLSSIVAFTDPPDHTRIRKVLRQAFTPKVLRHQQAVVDATVDEYFQELRRAASTNGEDQPVDVHRLLSYPFPARVISGMLGVPDEDHERFQKWALDVVLFVGSGRLDRTIALSALESVRELRAFMPGLVARRRAEPGPDLLTSMIETADSDGGLSDDELFANALFLMTAGHETATNGISNGLLTLLRRPGTAAELAATPELISSAVEEMLRFESPVQMTPRLVGDDAPAEVAGRAVAPGDALVVLIGAANRDPEVFERPDEFIITRGENRHFAFGHGAHWCLGGNLARQEMAATIGRFVAEFPSARLATEPTWQASLNFRGPNELLVFLR